MVRPMGVRRLIWTVSSLLPTAKTAVCFALFLYLIVFPPNLNLISSGPELPPFARDGGYDRNGEKSALTSVSSAIPVLTAKPKGTHTHKYVTCIAFPTNESIWKIWNFNFNLCAF